MSLNQKQKDQIAKQIKQELPHLKFNEGRIEVRSYQVGDLVDFVYTMFKRGELIGRSFKKD